MPTNERLLVKHAVSGRTLLDSGRSRVDYSYGQAGEGWSFAIQDPPEDAAREIVRLRLELNVFIFEEADDRPTRKNWFYVKEGPVEFDEGRRSLTIRADSKISYVPDEFYQ